MFFVWAVALGGSAALVAGRPHHQQRREVAAFPAGMSWDIILNKGSTNLDDLASAASAEATAIDIDLFDNEASTVSALKSQNKHVICYFSAGSREDWREDAGQFKAEDYGQGLDGWAGENWVNVKSANVRSIMKARIELAAQKGCTAVDPDNTDGFNNNQDGFGLDQSAYADYVKFLASTAAANNLAIGLKNSLDLIPDVIDVIQFAVNEQCHDYNECDKYKPLTAANKAVFNIEYGGNACSSPTGVDLSILIKNQDQSLNALGGACKTSSGASAPAAEQSAVPETSAAPAPAQTPSSPDASAVMPSSPDAPAVTPTYAVKPSSTAGAVATPEPSAEAGQGEDDQEDGDDDEDENDSADQEDEDEDEDEDDDDGDEDGDEDVKPWWQRHHKHE